MRDVRRNAGLAQLQQWAAGAASGSAPLTLASVQTLPSVIGDIFDPLRNERKTTKQFLSLRLSKHYEQPLFWKSTFTSDAAITPNLEEIGEFRATSNLGLVTPLSEMLQLRVGLASEYDSQAREKGVESWDHVLTTSLRFKF